MNRRLVSAALLTAVLPFANMAFAKDAGTAGADTPYSVTGNVAIVSDYMFRGISQTWGGPAVQGGGDLTLKNGFAAGFWASSISKNSYPGGAMELDLYASCGASFNDGWSWRVGLYGYVYPGGNLDQAKPPLPSRSFNTLEVNAALTWKWLTLKYNYSLTDYFAVDAAQGYRGDSNGTQYIQLDAAIPLNDRWSLALHAAHTSIPARLVTPAGLLDPSYSDLGATLKYQFSAHWNASVGATYATNKSFYEHTESFLDPNDTKNVGGSRGFVMLQGTF
ncbi:MAG: hypothetical protein DYH18_03755 [Xanthomonadales bacterium PRO7]|jgi:uncharacterized protein (TIGR02001 family)|nr:hypothetical protein [Xanthomonadales bacterium PRO7]